MFSANHLREESNPRRATSRLPVASAVRLGHATKARLPSKQLSTLPLPCWIDSSSIEVRLWVLDRDSQWSPLAACL